MTTPAPIGVRDPNPAAVIFRTTGAEMLEAAVAACVELGKRARLPDDEVAAGIAGMLNGIALRILRERFGDVDAQEMTRQALNRKSQ